MAKRQIEKNTILNSQDIENKIILEIDIALKKMWRFVFNTGGNNRSSAKTDTLHTNWEYIFKNSFGDYKDNLVGSFIKTYFWTNRTYQPFLYLIFFPVQDKTLRGPI